MKAAGSAIGHAPTGARHWATWLRKGALTLVAATAATLALSRSAAALDFNLVPLTLPQCGDACPAVIVATGAITHTDAENFFAFAQRASQSGKVVRVVFLHSPGGNMSGALKLGYIFRQMKITTVVGQVSPGRMATGDCHSACVYLLMGGVKRVVPDGSRVGVHQMASSAIRQRDVLGGGSIDARYSEGEVLGVLRTYVSRMGVSPAIVGLAESVPHSSIKVLSRSELSRFKLAGAKL